MVIKTIVDTTGVTPAIAAQTLTLYFSPEKKVLPRHGEIELAGLTQAIAFMAEAGHLKGPLPPADQFADLSYLQAAGIR